MSTWSLRNRRSFAILQRLGEMTGAGIVLAANFDSVPQQLTDAQRAMAIAEAGESALSFAIETAGSAGGRGRGAKRIWKAVTPDNGAEASVFLAHGLAATTARLASAPGHHLNPERQEHARALLRDHLPWSDHDHAEVSDAAGGIDPTSASGVEDARIRVALGAIGRIVGPVAAQLPSFAEWFGGDAADGYVASLGWQICFNHSLRSFLAVTDPEGLARWEQASAQRSG
jgi:hypothetical protein